MLLVLLPVIVAITVAMLIYALTVPRPSQLQERLKAYGYDLQPGNAPDLNQSFAQRVLTPLGRGLLALAHRLTPNEIHEGAVQRLQHAGQPMDVATYLVLRLLVIVALPILVLLPALVARNVTWVNILVALVVLVVATRISDIWLTFRIDARLDNIRKTLPDAIDLITVCVEAGNGLESAMARITERTTGPLADEFKVTLNEIRLGKSRRDALRDLSDRVGLDDLRSFTAAVIQADQTGVSIAQVLRVQADAMRIRRRQRAEEKAAQAPVKMLLPMFVFIFPALLIVILGPALLRLTNLFGTILAN
jgi:tight adherence protein C